MLAKLSGKTHQVISGVSISTSDKKVVFDDITDVCFKQLTTDEIDYYITKYKPFDKAGAYGIQGAALGFIKDISGSYSSVVGLPVSKVLAEMQTFLKTDYKGLYELFNT